MKYPIISVKLHKPELPENLISKQDLLKNCGWASMVLVSAQAGSGKSTVVSAWLSEQNRAYCWYSLDEWDNDIVQFLAYLVTGLKSVDKNVFEVLNQLLDAYVSVGFDSFIRAYINQLHTVAAPFILVLDDYHIIRNEQIHQVLRTLIEHFPPSMQLVLITREDPPFSLAKLRASKRLLEIRISNLRFTDEQVKTYFVKALRIPLDDTQLMQLIRRTEGWIAGLQMTLLSIQGLDDVSNFVDTFAASHYYIMDYLLEEVLERHAPEIKSFLLSTSILDFFSADLCDETLQLDSGTSSEIIEQLVKSNSFIVPSDSSRKWYRYHHLFRDLLRQRLDCRPKSELEKLHVRAGLWFKANEREQEALHHLFKANAFGIAAELIECKWADMDMHLQSTSWLDMARQLPAAIIERCPVIAMGYGWALLDMGEIEASKPWFEKAQNLYERHQEDPKPDDVVINDLVQYKLLPATLASAYAYIAAAIGDIDGIFTYTQEALRQIPGDQYYKRGVVSMLLGIAHWQKGELIEAEAVVTQSLKSIKSYVNPLVENSYYMVLGELCIQQGDFGRAKNYFEQTISRVIEQNHAPIVLASLYLGLAKIAFLQRDNVRAYSLLEDSKAYGQRYALMDWKYKYNLLLARVYCREGLYDLARDCIAEGRANYYMNPLPDEFTLEDADRMIVNAENANRKNPASESRTPDKPGFAKEHANQALKEPLTIRELEVLALITAGLSNQEICDKLFLALSTVKSYNQNIFGKLQVNRRTHAVSKARELGLV